MPTAPADAAPSSLTASLPWLLRLRFALFLGLLLAHVGAWCALGLRVPVAPVLSVFAIALGSVPAMAACRRRLPLPHLVAAGLVLDALLLFALLGLSGGPANPFTALFLVLVTLAAMLLRPAFAWTMVALCAGLFALLFKFHLPLIADGMPAPCCQEGEEGLSFHLYGMWVAFVAVAACVAAFVSRMAAAMRAREAQLGEAHEKANRFAALAALSAGAAHEIASPLSTIAVAAKEMERAAEGELREDAKLIRAEVDRCRAILDGMNPGQAGAETPAQVGAVCAAVATRFGVPCDMGPEAAQATLPMDAAAAERMLGNLVKNAVEACGKKPVLLCARRADGHLRLEVSDEGPGMDPAVLARAGEPFFTTKDPGRGMGLGLFISRLLTERAGGRFTIESGRGTRITLEFPAP